jgi:hypothetical protein
MTPERLAEVRRKELLAEFDAVMKERDALASAIHEACDIIETADARNLATDGPASGSPPQMSLTEWRRLYVVLEDSVTPKGSGSLEANK